MATYRVYILGNYFDNVEVVREGGKYHFRGHKEEILDAWREYLKGCLAGGFDPTLTQLYLRPPDADATEEYPYTMLKNRELYCVQCTSEYKLYEDFVEWMDEGMTDAV
jgi:hypothetical protein